jgi:nuclear control of ATPase protein 2
MSDFASRHTTSLLASALPASGSQSSRSESKQTLQALLVSLNPPIAPDSTAVHDALHTLRTLEEQRPTPFSAKTDDDEESALESAVLARITVALYAKTLNTQLTQAAEAETEAEWWSDILRSQLDVLSYLLPSMSNPYLQHSLP